MKREILHQIINGLVGIVFGAGGQVCVFAGGDDAGMTEKILHILQANARFDQMSGIAVPQTMGSDVFLSCMTRPLCAEWLVHPLDPVA